MGFSSEVRQLPKKIEKLKSGVHYLQCYHHPVKNRKTCLLVIVNKNSKNLKD